MGIATISSTSGREAAIPAAATGSTRASRSQLPDSALTHDTCEPNRLNWSAAANLDVFDLPSASAIHDGDAIVAENGVLAAGDAWVQGLGAEASGVGESATFEFDLAGSYRRLSTYATVLGGSDASCRATVVISGDGAGLDTFAARPGSLTTIQLSLDGVSTLEVDIEVSVAGSTCRPALVDPLLSATPVLPLPQPLA